MTPVTPMNCDAHSCVSGCSRCWLYLATTGMSWHACIRTSSLSAVFVHVPSPLVVRLGCVRCHSARLGFEELMWPNGQESCSAHVFFCYVAQAICALRFCAQAVVVRFIH